MFGIRKDELFFIQNEKNNNNKYTIYVYLYIQQYTQYIMVLNTWIMDGYANGCFNGFIFYFFIMESYLFTLKIARLTTVIYLFFMVYDGVNSLFSAVGAVSLSYVVCKIERFVPT